MVYIEGGLCFSLKIELHLHVIFLVLIYANDNGAAYFGSLYPVEKGCL